MAPRTAWYPTRRGNWRWRKQGSTTSTPKSPSAPGKCLWHPSPSIFICISPRKRTGSCWRDKRHRAPRSPSVNSNPSEWEVSSTSGKMTWSLSTWQTPQKWSTATATPTSASSSCSEERAALSWESSPTFLSKVPFPVSLIYVPLPLCFSCFLICIFCYLLMRARGPWEHKWNKVWSCSYLLSDFFLLQLVIWYLLVLCVGVHHTPHSWQGWCPCYVTRALFTKLYHQCFFPRNVGWPRAFQPSWVHTYLQHHCLQISIEKHKKA